MSASILIPCKELKGPLFCTTDYLPDDRIIQKSALPYITPINKNIYNKYNIKSY
jgi:hypothetical protein